MFHLSFLIRFWNITMRFRLCFCNLTETFLKRAVLVTVMSHVMFLKPPRNISNLETFEDILTFTNVSRTFHVQFETFLICTKCFKDMFLLHYWNHTMLYGYRPPKFVWRYRCPTHPQRVKTEKTTNLEYFICYSAVKKIFRYVK